MNMEDTIQYNNLVQEYLDVGNTLRHYGNLQFAQMTLCVAMAAGALSVLLGKESVKLCWVRLILEIGSTVIALMFLTMSARVSEYWDARCGRAIEIERQLGFGQYSTPSQKRGFCAIELQLPLFIGQFLHFSFY